MKEFESRIKHSDLFYDPVYMFNKTSDRPTTTFLTDKNNFYLYPSENYYF